MTARLSVGSASRRTRPLASKPLTTRETRLWLRGGASAQFRHRHAVVGRRGGEEQQDLELVKPDAVLVGQASIEDALKGSAGADQSQERRGLVPVPHSFADQVPDVLPVRSAALRRKYRLCSDRSQRRCRNHCADTSVAR